MYLVKKEKKKIYLVFQRQRWAADCHQRHSRELCDSGWIRLLWRSLEECILATSGIAPDRSNSVISTFLMVLVCVIFPSKFIFAFPQHNLLFFAPDSFSFHLCKTSPASINLFLPISSFDPCHICRSISTISTHVLHKNAWFQSSQASTSETIQLVIVLPYFLICVFHEQKCKHYPLVLLMPGWQIWRPVFLMSTNREQMCQENWPYIRLLGRW